MKKTYREARGETVVHDDNKVICFSAIPSLSVFRCTNECAIEQAG